MCIIFFFFKQKTAYEMRISDWSSDVCSSDLANAYIPQGRRSHQVDALSTASLSGTSVIFRGGEEKSLSGFDAEIGWRVPVFDAQAAQQLRVYGGEIGRAHV